MYNFGHSNVFNYYIIGYLILKNERIYRFDRKKRISDSDCTAKNAWYKKGPFFYDLKGK